MNKLLPLLIITVPLIAYSSDADLIGPKLVKAHEVLTRTLTLIKLGYDRESLCESVPDLNVSQKKECKAFALRLANKVAKLGEPMELKHEVDAAEENYLARMTHEFGHRALADEGKAKQFKSGKELLDVVGQALTHYSIVNAAPEQDPPAIPEGVAKKTYCSRLTDPASTYLAGLRADLSQEAISKEKLAAWKKKWEKYRKESRLAASSHLVLDILNEEETRKKEIQAVYRRLASRNAAPEEVSLVMAAMSKGLSWDMFVASLVGGYDYSQSRLALTNEDFITQAYRDILGRAPTEKEMAEGIVQLEGKNRSAFVVALYDENTEAKGKLIEQWYKAYLNRMPTSMESDDALARLRNGGSWDGERTKILTTPEYAMLQVMRSQHCK